MSKLKVKPAALNKKSRKDESDDDDDVDDYANFAFDDDDDEDEDDEIESGDDDNDNDANDRLDMGELDDEELRQAFAKGLLKGPIVDMRRPKINNEGRLKERLEDIKQIVDDKAGFSWVERIDFTSSEPVVVEDVQDDFKREMSFYNQALEAAIEARKKLEAAGVKVVRPSDYFAEMVKTDDHMRKIRETLLSEHKSIERAEQAKKSRQMKKLGKKVQQQILEERSKKKAEDLEAIKKFKKDRSAKPDFLDDADDQFNVSLDQNLRQKRKAEGGEPNHAKRARKDAKFGSGGRKRGAKKNTAESSRDDSGFSLARNKALPKGFKKPAAGKKTKAARPGKNKRQQAKNRSR